MLILRSHNAVMSVRLGKNQSELVSSVRNKPSTIPARPS
jgi:hypothetical protein